MEPNNKNIDNINETLDIDELEKVAGGSQAAFISNAGVAGVAGAANNASNGLIGSRKNDGGLSRF